MNSLSSAMVGTEPNYELIFSMTSYYAEDIRIQAVKAANRTIITMTACRLCER